ncbi:UNVERIFIED_CONTAM: hypothetical protein FKN15_053126 [Acipenser sinensis]
MIPCVLGVNQNPVIIKELSFIVRIVPSPDWFVGVDSLNLCDGDRWKEQLSLDLYPYDAGTDSGFTFSSPDFATIPQDTVTQLCRRYKKRIHEGHTVPRQTLPNRRQDRNTDNNDVIQLELEGNDNYDMSIAVNMKCKTGLGGYVHDIVDGKMYNKFVKKHNLGKEDLTLMWSCDGVPIFKSSNYSIWPLQFTVNKLTPNQRKENITIAALWFGLQKPRMDTFLKRFVEECCDLASTPIQWIILVTLISLRTSLRWSPGEDLCPLLHPPVPRPTIRSPLSNRWGPSSPVRGPYLAGLGRGPIHPQVRPWKRAKIDIYGLEGTSSRNDDGEAAAVVQRAEVEEPRPRRKRPEEPGTSAAAAEPGAAAPADADKEGVYTAVVKKRKLKKRTSTAADPAAGEEESVWGPIMVSHDSDVGSQPSAVVEPSAGSEGQEKGGPQPADLVSEDPVLEGSDVGGDSLGAQAGPVDVPPSDETPQPAGSVAEMPAADGDSAGEEENGSAGSDEDGWEDGLSDTSQLSDITASQRGKLYSLTEISDFLEKTKAYLCASKKRQLNRRASNKRARSLAVGVYR